MRPDGRGNRAGIGAQVVVDVLPLPDGVTPSAHARASWSTISPISCRRCHWQLASGSADFTISVDVPSRRAAQDHPTLLEYR